MQIRIQLGKLEKRRAPKVPEEQRILNKIYQSINDFKTKTKVRKGQNPRNTRATNTRSKDQASRRKRVPIAKPKVLHNI